MTDSNPFPGITVKRDETSPFDAASRPTPRQPNFPIISKPFEAGASQRIREKARERRKGIPFTLPVCQETVLVRMVGFEFLMRNGLIPAALQDPINQLLANKQRGVPLGGDGEPSILIELSTYTGFQDMIDVAFIHGMVTPRVYLREADVDQAQARGEDAVWIEDFDEDDRAAYWAWTQEVVNADAARVLPFPDAASEPVRIGPDVQYPEQTPVGVSPG